MVHDGGTQKANIYRILIAQDNINHCILLREENKQKYRAKKNNRQADYGIKFFFFYGLS